MVDIVERNVHYLCVTGGVEDQVNITRGSVLELNVKEICNIENWLDGYGYVNGSVESFVCGYV